MSAVHMDWIILAKVTNGSKSFKLLTVTYIRLLQIYYIFL